MIYVSNIYCAYKRLRIRKTIVRSYSIRVLFALLNSQQSKIALNQPVSHQTTLETRLVAWSRPIAISVGLPSQANRRASSKQSLASRGPPSSSACFKTLQTRDLAYLSLAIQSAHTQTSKTASQFACVNAYIASGRQIN